MNMELINLILAFGLGTYGTILWMFSDDTSLESVMYVVLAIYVQGFGG